MSAKFRNLRITFEYNSSSFMEIVDQYKTVSFLKRQAKNQFYQLPPDFKLIYQGRDISRNEDTMLSQLFHGKQSIRLQCVPSHSLNISLDIAKSPLSGLICNTEPLQQNVPLMNSIAGKRVKSGINEVYFNPISFSKPQKTKLTNTKKLRNIALKHRMMSERGRNNNNEQIDSINSMSIPNSSVEREIQSISISQPLHYASKLNDHETIDIDNQSLICECNGYTISQFCRTCNKFLCNPCRLNDTHKEHSAMIIDINDFEGSLKEIVQVVRKELLNKKKAINVNYYNYQQSQLNIDNERTKFAAKLDEVHKRYNDMLAQLLISS